MDRYTKATEVWLLLHQVEQLIINDPDYSDIRYTVANCVDIVGVFHSKLEAEQCQSTTSTSSASTP